MLPSEFITRFANDTAENVREDVRKYWVNHADCHMFVVYNCKVVTYYSTNFTTCHDYMRAFGGKIGLVYLD